LGEVVFKTPLTVEPFRRVPVVEPDANSGTPPARLAHPHPNIVRSKEKTGNPS
jgi:hypothetical protein